MNRALYAYIETAPRGSRLLKLYQDLMRPIIEPPNNSLISRISQECSQEIFIHKSYRFNVTGVTVQLAASEQVIISRFIYLSIYRDLYRWTTGF